MLKFRQCACRRTNYLRVQRAWWMRIIPSRRLYRCQSCGALLWIVL
jgi:predicted SprT family Zn-dependent metalloprotease